MIEVNIGLFKSIFLRIFDHFRDKVDNPRSIKLQKYSIKDPLGIVNSCLKQQRLQLAETFIYFLNLLDPSKSKFDEDELSTLLQILFIWLFEKKYHSIYMNKMIRLLNILIEPRHSKSLAIVLVRLNTVSVMHDMYFKILLNDVMQTQLLADQLLIFTQIFVVKITEVLKTQEKSKSNNELVNVFSIMTAWNELRDDVV